MSLRCRLALVLLTLGGNVQAEAQAPALPLISAERQGYAFEYPRVLAQQRMFGLAHGVDLLAAACRQLPGSGESDTAYKEWREQQKLMIDATRFELARFYFGPRAGEAEWGHLVRALSLREALDLTPEQLAPACKTLPQALRQPRYDLAAMFQLEEAMAAMTVVVRAETQFTICSKRLPEADRPLLAQRFTEWQSTQEKHPEQARIRLAEQLKATKSGSLDEWEVATTRRFINPPPATCAKLAEWLISPGANVAASFAVAPAPTNAAMPPADGGGSGQAEPSQSAAPQSPTPSPEMQQEPSPVATAAPVEISEDETRAAGPSLFDLIKRLFDERPDPAQEPVRARSQRAHP